MTHNILLDFVIYSLFFQFAYFVLRRPYLMATPVPGTVNAASGKDKSLMERAARDSFVACAGLDPDLKVELEKWLSEPGNAIENDPKRDGYIRSTPKLALFTGSYRFHAPLFVRFYHYLFGAKVVLPAALEHGLGTDARRAFLEDLFPLVTAISMITFGAINGSSVLHLGKAGTWPILYCGLTLALGITIFAEVVMRLRKYPRTQLWTTFI